MERKAKTTKSQSKRLTIVLNTLIEKFTDLVKRDHFGLDLSRPTKGKNQ